MEKRRRCLAGKPKRKSPPTHHVAGKGHLKRERRVKRFAKLVIFVTLLLLVVALTKVEIPYQVQAAGLIPLPDKYMDAVSIDFIGGAVSTIFSSGEHGEEEQFKTDYQMWKVTDGVALQPQTSNVQGCTTEYTNNMVVNFTISNSLMEPTVGTVRVAVYDYESRTLLSNRYLVLNFEPRNATYGTAKFSILSFVFDPIFLVQVTFPTSDELVYLPAEVKQLSPLEYVLVLLGFLAP